MRHLLLLTVSVLLCGSPAWGKLVVVGKGAAMHLDSSQLPPPQKDTYERIMRVKCVKCHTLERAVIAIKTGVGPISNLPFDKSSTSAYGIKMMRKTDSNMSRPEIKDVVSLLNYLLDQVTK